MHIVVYKIEQFIKYIQLCFLKMCCANKLDIPYFFLIYNYALTKQNASCK